MARFSISEFTPLILGGAAIYFLSKSDFFSKAGAIPQGIGDIGTGTGTGLAGIGLGLGSGLSQIGGGIFQIGSGIDKSLAGLGQGLSSIGNAVTNVGAGVGNLLTEVGGFGASYETNPQGNKSLKFGSGVNTPASALISTSTGQTSLSGQSTATPKKSSSAPEGTTKSLKSQEPTVIQTSTKFSLVGATAKVTKKALEIGLGNTKKLSSGIKSLFGGK